MEKHIPKTETRYDELVGTISLNFKDGLHLNSFAEKVAGMDLQKYQPISVRAFYQKDFILTFYALEKDNWEEHYKRTGRLRVVKFKIEHLSPLQIVNYLNQLDFTLVNGEFKVEDFEVIEE